MTPRTRTAIKPRRTTDEQLEDHTHFTNTLVPVAYTVVAGPPHVTVGSTVTILRPLEDTKKAGDR